jgi:hypothetical protein
MSTSFKAALAGAQLQQAPRRVARASTSHRVTAAAGGGYKDKVRGGTAKRF